MPSHRPSCGVRRLRARNRGFAAALIGAALLSSAPVGAPASDCSGRIINPVADVCWSCLFPIKLGATLPVSAEGALPDVDTGASVLCSCGSGANLSAGLTFSFWEPLRTAEIVRHAWCLPSLGGVSLTGGSAQAGAVRGIDHARTPKTADTRRRTAFWNVHWYMSPWLFVLEAVLDNGCLEQAPWDLAYLSELDPLWDDTLSSFLLAPDAALFTAGAAFGACAVDCIAAAAGTSIKSLYWCSGCQGAVFPLSGWMAGQVSPVQAWLLMSHRFAVKLSREGILWSAHGKDGLCGPYLTPLMDKSVWRTQLVYPSRSTGKVDGACCFPLGRSAAAWAAGKTYPGAGEDGAVLLWRKRDCCLTKELDAPGAPTGTADAAGIRGLFPSTHGSARSRSRSSAPDVQVRESEPSGPSETRDELTPAERRLIERLLAGRRDQAVR